MYSTVKTKDLTADVEYRKKVGVKEKEWWLQHKTAHSVERRARIIRQCTDGFEKWVWS